ncbi:glycerophosphodiester phosphodiesterase [Bdellovibrio bacteriovorus]|uniref:glycerophosphodiester phosphodiesterase n=1 Tax=Bdellovibrio bacteriovorus TaxID=959 RepID=UPI0035A6EE30
MIFFVALLLLGLFLFIKHFTWKALPWPEGAVKPPPYQGHRGYWKGGAQENTLASFEAAKRRGLMMIELDIRLSGDGVPVVFHDTDLKRLKEIEKIVLHMTATELRAEAGAPSLEEVFRSELIPSFINIELKTSAMWDGTLERAVADLIKKYKMEKRVLFSSFNPLSLWRLSRLLPQVPRALLATQEEEPENKIYLKHLWLAPYVRIHALHLDYHYVSVEDLKRWQKRKVPVALWTVNDKEKAEAYLKAGALSIISDTLGEKPSANL